MPRGQKKRKAGEGKAAASKKIMTEQAAEAMESGKYMWPTGCVKKYLTTVKKYCYVFYFNLFHLLFHCYIVRPQQQPLLAQSLLAQPLLPLYKLIKHGWWHPHEVLEGSWILIPRLHNKLVI